MTKERMVAIVLSYGVRPRFVCRLSDDSKCIFSLSSIEVAMYKVTFRARFHLPLYHFIECLLDRHRLEYTQIHPNVWKAIFSFMIKFVEVGFEPKIRELRLVLALKATPSSKSVIYISYKSSVLASLIF